MATLLELKTQQQEALNKADAALKTAEAAARPMNASEQEQYNNAMGDFRAIGVTVKAKEELANLHLLNPAQMLAGVHPEAEGADAEFAAHLRGSRRTFSKAYFNAFAQMAKARGAVTPALAAALAAGYDAEGGYAFPALNAALSEGTTTAGGFAVPVTVDQQIVPLAPPVIGVETIATVIPTSMDVKFPRKTAHGTATYKAESAAFGGADPTIDQFTLSAYMVGHSEAASWELLQDVVAFQSFMTDDILLSIATLKENYYVNGTGTNQPQGLIGNTGTGTGAAYAVTGTPATDSAALLLATFDVLGTISPVYDAGASWLMQRATSVAIRKAQMQTNLFAPVYFTDGAGKDYLHGRPVTFSGAMPLLPTATTTGVSPILFGDFKRGYLIGHRGGSGVNVKILDQIQALNGQLVILGYQRVDARVRRSEAIQQISFSHS